MRRSPPDGSPARRATGPRPPPSLEPDQRCRCPAGRRRSRAAGTSRPRRPRPDADRAVWRSEPRPDVPCVEPGREPSHARETWERSGATDHFARIGRMPCPPKPARCGRSSRSGRRCRRGRPTCSSISLADPTTGCGSLDEAEMSLEREPPSHRALPTASPTSTRAIASGIEVITATGSQRDPWCTPGRVVKVVGLGVPASTPATEAFREISAAMPTRNGVGSPRLLDTAVAVRGFPSPGAESPRAMSTTWRAPAGDVIVHTRTLEVFERLSL